MLQQGERKRKGMPTLPLVYLSLSVGLSASLSLPYVTYLVDWALKANLAIAYSLWVSLSFCLSLFPAFILVLILCIICAL